MSSLYTRNSILWISYYRNKIHFRKSLKLPDDGESWKLAKIFQKKLDGEIALELFNNLLNNEKQILLSEAYQMFSNEKQLSGNNIYYIAYKYLLEITGNIPTSMVMIDQLNKLKNKLLYNKKSQNTVVSYFNHLRVFFNWCVKKQYISTNPIPKLKWQLKNVVTLTESELELIINYLKTVNEPMANLIKYLSLTGLRLSEALALKKTDIDYNSNILIINNTKASRTESFPLYPELKLFLMENNNIYNGDRGYALKAFQKACSALELKKYKIHDIRRTFASKYATILTPIELQKLTRHSKIETTLKHYVNLNLQTIGNKMVHT